MIIAGSVPEWLTGWTWNPLDSVLVGSNPTWSEGSIFHTLRNFYVHRRKSLLAPYLRLIFCTCPLAPLILQPCKTNGAFSRRFFLLRIYIFSHTKSISSIAYSSIVSRRSFLFALCPLHHVLNWPNAARDIWNYAFSTPTLFRGVGGTIYSSKQWPHLSW